MNTRTIFTLIIGIIVGIFLCNTCHNYTDVPCEQQVKRDTLIKVDTLVQLDTVTVYKTLPGKTKTVYINNGVSTPLDTINSDTVLYVGNYEDSLLTLVDSIWIKDNIVIEHKKSITMDTLYKEVEITRDSLIEKEVIINNTITQFKRGFLWGLNVDMNPNPLDVIDINLALGYRTKKGMILEISKSIECIECFNVGFKLPFKFR